jgi:hypothetical protein
MKNNIVADGCLRFLLAGRKAASEDIEKKYAAELAKADPARKHEIHRKMAYELLARKKILEHKPSAGTLW